MSSRRDGSTTERYTEDKLLVPAMGGRDLADVDVGEVGPREERRRFGGSGSGGGSGKRKRERKRKRLTMNRARHLSQVAEQEFIDIQAYFNGGS
jgi:hypothetical protein